MSNPNKKSSPYFLFTARDVYWLPNVATLNLDVLTMEESIELIENEFTKITYVPSRTEVESLAKNLQYFPLALQQAIAYIREQRGSVLGQGYTILHYLTEFDKTEEKKNLLSYEYPENFENDKTIFKIFNITINAIRKHKDSEKAVKILQLIAYLYADDIDPRLFLTYFQDEAGTNQAICLLVRYSIITKVEGKNSYQIHRLVQAVVQIMFKSGEKKILEQTIRLVIPEALENYMSFLFFIFTRVFRIKDLYYSYNESIYTCTVIQVLHMNSIFAYLKKKYDNLYTKYEELFEEINYRTFLNVALNDDIDQIKVLDKSKEFLKKFIETNLYRLTEDDCQKVIKYFFDRNLLDLSGQTNFFNTPIYIAIAHRNLGILEFLLQNGTDAKIKCTNGYTLLHFACMEPENFFSRPYFVETDSLQIVKILVENESVDVDAKGVDGKNALHCALDCCEDESFNYLQTKMSSVDERILIEAVERDRLLAVKTLFEKHFKVDHKFEDGRTPIEVAVENFSLQTILLLKTEFKKYLEQGGNINKADRFNQTLLIKNVRFNPDLNDVKFLVENGADINAKYEDGRSALYYAVILDKYEIFEFLLSKCSSVDESIFIKAIKSDALPYVIALLEKHFKSDYHFKNGKTPIVVAIENVSLRIVLFLKNEFKE